MQKQSPPSKNKNNISDNTSIIKWVRIALVIIGFVLYGASVGFDYTLDDDLSLEVVNGLLAYDFIYEVTITDELGSVLATGSKERPISSTRWITAFIAEDSRVYTARLSIPGYGNAVAGTILFTVDIDVVLAPFFNRSGLILGE